MIYGSLRVLDCDNNQLQRLPDSFADLKNLERRGSVGPSDA